MLISIVIPCRNEEKRIGPTLDAVNDYLRTQEYDSEVLVVDNGSTDRTRAVVEERKAGMRNLRLIEENSYGKGWAVRQGMLAAKGDYRLLTDADNSTDIRQLGNMLHAAWSGYDVIAGSRRLPESHIVHPQPWHRRILGDVFASFVRWLVPLGIKDTQNGFKLFSRQAAETVFPHQTIFYWAWDVEVLALAKKFGFLIKEEPIIWVNDERSHVNIKGMVRMLFEVIITSINLATRDYRPNHDPHPERKDNVKPSMNPTT